MKIIQINGFRGLITLLFTGVCLFAGFVMFPGLVIKHFWNLYLVNLYMFPVLNLFQSVVLWAMMATVYCIITKNDFALSFKNSSALSQREIDEIIQQSKTITPMPLFGKKIFKDEILKTLNKNSKSIIDNQVEKFSKELKTEEDSKKTLNK